jgi:hypothetical protein
MQLMTTTMKKITRRCLEKKERKKKQKTDFVSSARRRSPTKDRHTSIEYFINGGIGKFIAECI